LFKSIHSDPLSCNLSRDKGVGEGVYFGVGEGSNAVVGEEIVVGTEVGANELVRSILVVEATPVIVFFIGSCVFE
jgi:hypothetical protein